MSNFTSPVDAMLSGTGPGAYAERSDVPDYTVDGEPKIVPISQAPNFFIEPRDPDPRGFDIVGADGVVAGVVRDLWVDRSEPQLRYLEVALAGGDIVLVPATVVRVRAAQRRVAVRAILGEHFAHVPRTARPDRITLREEDRIMAYFAAGTLYATPRRIGPLL